MKLPEPPPKTGLPRYEVGDRVKLSDLGKTRSPRLAGSGLVVAVPRGGRSVWVRFEGNTSPTPLHASYIEPA